MSYILEDQHLNRSDRRSWLKRIEEERAATLLLRELSAKEDRMRQLWHMEGAHSAGKQMPAPVRVY
jgi:hypothetical protein